MKPVCSERREVRPDKNRIVVDDVDGSAFCLSNKGVAHVLHREGIRHGRFVFRWVGAHKNHIAERRQPIHDRREVSLKALHTSRDRRRSVSVVRSQLHDDEAVLRCDGCWNRERSRKVVKVIALGRGPDDPLIGDNDSLCDLDAIDAQSPVSGETGVVAANLDGFVSDIPEGVSPTVVVGAVDPAARR